MMKWNELSYTLQYHCHFKPLHSWLLKGIYQPSCSCLYIIMSYNGIGLSSAKGSSTSGYVQQSLAFTNRKKDPRLTTHDKEQQQQQQQQQIQPAKDESVISHKAKRQIELLVSEYRDKLEDGPDDLSDDTIDSKCEDYRRSILEGNEQSRSQN